MTTHRVGVLLLVAACGTVDANDQLPYRTVIDTVGDTVVAHTTGTVPDSLVRRLTLEWRAEGDPNDTASIGDVSEIAVASAGRVYVWDPATPALWIVDDAGKSIRRVGRKGSGPGEYQRSNGIAIRSNGHLVLWDEGNTRVNAYDRDGGYVSSFTVPFTHCCPGGAVKTDSLNRIWLRAWLGSFKEMDKAKHSGLPAPGREVDAWFLFDSSGKVIDSLVMHPLPGDHPRVTAINQTRTGTSMSSMVLPFGTVTSYAVGPHGELVFGQGRPYALYTELNGKPLRLERESHAVPVSDDERSQRRSAIEFNMRRIVPTWSWSGPDIPSEKPYYTSITVSGDGRIWVSLSVESEEYEPDPPPASQANPPPPVRFRSKERRYDVFERDGRYLGQVVAPRLFGAYVMKGDSIWGVLRDENDLPTVVKMRLDRPF